MLIILRENTAPSVGEESLNTASIVQPIPLIFAIRMNLVWDVVKKSALCDALYKSAVTTADLRPKPVDLSVL